MSLNYLSGIILEAFGNLPNLSYLNLSGNSLSSSIPTRLGNMTTLKFLDLSYNSFSGSLPFEFTRLENLQTLSISFNVNPEIKSSNKNCVSEVRSDVTRSIKYSCDDHEQIKAVNCIHGGV
ncbi:hypothetical protein L2E82_30267 [Cichorium intybus]|uniref:Uncharacterized protein n=1 Tax=Cichorium intybus TaxID=13427 RepID=A0ACB9D040_CICIN|nr:hypothetical protein L2E82_30267 [Cichorium intybus]